MTPYKCHQFIDILMGENTDKKQVCRCQPPAVDTNVSFIIELDCVCFADDMGSWKSTGTKHTYFHFDKDGEILYGQKASCGKKEYYDLIRCYYVHGTCSKFHRLIISIEVCTSFINLFFFSNRSCRSAQHACWDSVLFQRASNTSFCEATRELKK